MHVHRRKSTIVKIGNIKLGGDNPVRVQSMTNTDTGDITKTVDQIVDLYNAGSEIVRFTVQNDRMAHAVKPIAKELENRGYRIPLVGDFHFNGHALLQIPECAEYLDKYRINPGHVGNGEKHDANFKMMVDKAIEYDKAVRIGVNGGSLDQELLTKMMDENSKKLMPLDAKTIFLESMAESALGSARAAENYGLPKNKIVLSGKVSEAQELIYVYRKLAKESDYCLHLGLTEAGLGTKGIVASSTAIGVLLNEGIGDTIRVSITPRPGGARTEEVMVAKQILQSLDIRSFVPTVTSCPGCGRTTSSTFQVIAEQVTEYLEKKTNEWKNSGYNGVETMRVAVMGCVVNGPGEAKDANIGLSLPGTGETPSAPVFIDGKPFKVLKGNAQELSAEFLKMIDHYVESHYASKKETETTTA